LFDERESLSKCSIFSKLLDEFPPENRSTTIVFLRERYTVSIWREGKAEMWNFDINKKFPSL